MDLVINSRTEADITRTAGEIAEKYGVSVTPVAADITTSSTDHSCRINLSRALKYERISRKSYRKEKRRGVTTATTTQ